MATRYLVLRSDKPFTSLDAGIADRWVRGPAPQGLSIETYDGHERDGGSLRADPHNAAVMDAETMLQLIAPTARVATAAEPAAWPLKNVGGQRVTAGVVAVGADVSQLTGQGVTLAVLDTGVDFSHPLFAGLTPAKRNFTNTGAADDVADKNGHGTHCAGTACGRVVNGIRVGVAPGVAKLCAGKVLDDTGSGSLEMLLKGMVWAVLDQKAMVVSMSLGYDLPGNASRLMNRGMDPALATAAAMRQQADIMKGISTLRAFLESQCQSVVFVAATGNESNRPGFVLPASLPAAELFAVGAIGPSPADASRWTVAGFSNSRAQVVAPGVDVLSAAPGGGWVAMSGTSMATPHVAGVAALWVQKLRDEGNLTLPDAVRSMLTTTAKRTHVDGDLDAVGSGIVQAPA